MNINTLTIVVLVFGLLTYAAGLYDFAYSLTHYPAEMNRTFRPFGISFRMSIRKFGILIYSFFFLYLMFFSVLTFFTVL